MYGSAVSAFFKRFAVKFIEVVGAGIATALSGYLLAHFSGYWSSPPPAPMTPPTVQVAPGSTSVVTKSQRSPAGQAASAETKDPRTAGTNASSAAQATRGNVNAKEPAPSRKQASGDARSAEAKPAVETKSQPPLEAKPRETESVEAQVRAALANIDASRPSVPPVEAPSSHQADIPLSSAAVAAEPRPAESPVASVTPSPPAEDVAPPQAQQAAKEPEPLAPVEIKSMPVAGVDSTAPSAPAAKARKEAEEGAREPVEEDKNLLTALKKIPDLFRPKAAAVDNGDAPRPPRPVGN